MFIDLAAFILEWRSNHPGRYPPEAEMRDYLKAQGWRTKPSRAKPNGGEITTRTVQEMMLAMTDGEDIFPPANLDRIAVNTDRVALAGTEIATVHISPRDWATSATKFAMAGDQHGNTAQRALNNLLPAMAARRCRRQARADPATAAQPR